MNRPRPQANDIDPDVEKLSSLIQRSRLSDKAIAEKVSAARHHKMSPDTVRNVRELATRRPHNFTMSWIGWAIGYSREWRRIGD